MTYIDIAIASCGTDKISYKAYTLDSKFSATWR